MISVVIGCLNEGDQLKITLEGALAIERPQSGLEFSIVDDGSTDLCTAFLDEEPWSEYRREGWLRLRRHATPEGISRGRFFGALGCRGDVLVFMDAHLCFPQNDLWLQVEQHFADDRSDLLALDCRDRNTGASSAGSIYTSKRLDHQATVWMSVKQEPLVNVPVPFINGGFFAIRRSVYEQLGGFPLFFQGWGHEDRYLSMLAGYRGYRCMVNQELIVDHLYKAAFPEPRPEPQVTPEASCDPTPQDGIPPSIQAPFTFALQPEDRFQQLLMNSLRYSAALYSETVQQSMLDQLRADHGEERIAQGLAAIAAEQPQLSAYRQALGLDDANRDRAMEAFFDRWQPYLPMLVEAELQQIRSLPPAEALARIQALPRELGSVHGSEAEQYAIARLYLEASFAHALADWAHVITCLSDALSIDPDYMPALRMLTIALRSAGRNKAYRLWLEHANAVIERHQPSFGPGPIGAWHPASNNIYMRNMYWLEVDRSIWRDLADLHAAEGQRDEAARWIGKLLLQTPGDPELLQRLTELYSDTTRSAS